MPRKSKKERKRKRENRGFETPTLHPDVKKSVWIVLFLGVAVLFVLAAMGQAGPFGKNFYLFFNKLLGWGYFLLPVVSFVLAFSFIAPEKKRFFGVTLAGGFLFLISGLGFIDIISPGNGGLAGMVVGSLKNPFGATASLVITLTTLIISFLVVLNRPLRIPKIVKTAETEINLPDEPVSEGNLQEEARSSITQEEEEILDTVRTVEKKPPLITKSAKIKNYVAPPIKLLSTSFEKPTVGDLRAGANIIKRTLESFGIVVEVGEISVGPTVTRYALKPAEGVKLSRITALNQDLSLALAAHPIRIEAPIPGKSLIGIEVPNKSAALVRLGNLLLYPEFQKSSSLSFVLGRDVSGNPVFVDITKMPHLMIAGATGSGKSIMVHSLLTSLLYKNSPETLRLVLIDLKRVELSIYNGIPHLISPVITESKEAIGALRWAISEMDHRYRLLLEAGVRDIKSYNRSEKRLPYLLIVIDELADLMSSYGREVEGSIIRLAQMSRATGLHLIVSTQRPSVEVITGLIKANITSRIALQVASQIDSRTILDTAGAEKLLGNGDLLFISAEVSKPRRIQGAYITEEEVKKVISFIKENNKPDLNNDEDLAFGEQKEQLPSFSFEDYSGDSDDELYNDAISVVRDAKKASASLLQRRLKIGYARAARLLDVMEEKGIVGPGEGAKPREVY